MKPSFLSSVGFITACVILIPFCITSILPDTVALRGTNTIARGVNFPVEVPLTGKALIMSISQKSPPLPLVTNRARLKWLHDDYYELENLDPEDIIFSRNKPTITQTKGGWRVTFRGP